MQDNVFDGAGLRGDADSWVDVKGNGWVIRDNQGTSAPGSGFEVHRLVQGWGTGNVFDGSSADVRGSGYGFELRPIADNRVTCSNSAVDAARGLTTPRAASSPITAGIWFASSGDHSSVTGRQHGSKQARSRRCRLASLDRVANFGRFKGL